MKLIIKEIIYDIKEKSIKMFPFPSINGQIYSINGQVMAII